MDEVSIVCVLSQNNIMRIFITFLFILSCFIADAQKFIQMDAFGKKKAIRFYVGDELTFRVVGDDYFHTVIIQGLNTEKGLIKLNHGQVRLSDITEIRMTNRDIQRRFLGRKLFNFGVAFIGIGIMDAVLFGSTFGAIGAFVGGTAIVGGIILRWIMKRRTFKINKNRRLRMINLNLDDVA